MAMSEKITYLCKTLLIRSGSYILSLHIDVHANYPSFFLTLQVSHLGNFSSTTLKATVRRLLSELFVTAVTQQYNFMGKKEKLSLKALTLNTAMLSK